MTTYRYISHPHIGDQIICTGAVHNVRLEHPDISFAVPENHPEICDCNPDYNMGNTIIKELGKITYGTLEEEQHGVYGTVVEGFTRSLCLLLNIPLVPIKVTHPVLYLDDEEREYAEQWRDAIIVNANCQRCSISKGNPYWQDVVDELKNDWCIIQVGGNEARDISPDLIGAEDMRGKTTIRQLMAMVYGCRMVLSPPSAISNIAGAWNKPQVVVNAAREPDILLGYANAVHVSHRCKCGWGVDTGCISCRIDSTRRGCHRAMTVGSREWCQCQVETTAADIIAAIQSLINIIKRGV